LWIVGEIGWMGLLVIDIWLLLGNDIWLLLKLDLVVWLNILLGKVIDVV